MNDAYKKYHKIAIMFHQEDLLNVRMKISKELHELLKFYLEEEFILENELMKVTIKIK